MRDATWMHRDERTLEQRARDQLYHMKHQEKELSEKLVTLRADIEKLEGDLPALRGI